MRLHRSAAGWTRSLVGRAAVLFMVGSSLFALGSFPPYALAVDGRVVATTFVIGAVFFTAAGLHQLADACRAAGGGPIHVHDRAWWAAAVQSVGTLFFNVNTIRALTASIDASASEVDRLIWRPDMLGSIAFIVASHLAWLDACGGLWAVKRGDTEWRMAALNYAGSIAFIASAVAAFVLPTTGEPVSIAVVNAGTFAGAVCFFLGAYLMLPEVDEVEVAGA